MNESANPIAAYVPPLQVLRGHVSRDTAYEIDGHRYGVRVSTIRYWVETATRGPKRQQRRVMAQTTNPNKPGSPWNNPWAKSTFFRWVTLCLDPNGQMEWIGVHDFDVTPEFDARLKLSGVYAQLTDDEREQYEVLADKSRLRRGPWMQFNRTVDAIAAHIAATGEDPHTHRGIWDSPDGPIFLGTDHVPVYLASARSRPAR